MYRHPPWCRNTRSFSPTSQGECKCGHNRFQFRLLLLSRQRKIRRGSRKKHKYIPRGCLAPPPALPASRSEEKPASRHMPLLPPPRTHKAPFHTHSTNRRAHTSCVSAAALDNASDRAVEATTSNLSSSAPSHDCRAPRQTSPEAGACNDITLLDLSALYRLRQRERDRRRRCVAKLVQVADHL